jgi:hypothetical protein
VVAEYDGHYRQALYSPGNPTPITDAVLANVQSVNYNTTHAYVSATGIPAYITRSIGMEIRLWLRRKIKSSGFP